MNRNKLMVPIKGEHRNKPTYKKIIAIVVIILFACGDCFPQSQKTGQIIITDVEQIEHIAALEKRIAEAGEDFVYI